METSDVVLSACLILTCLTAFLSAGNQMGAVIEGAMSSGGLAERSLLILGGGATLLGGCLIGVPLVLLDALDGLVDVTTAVGSWDGAHLVLTLLLGQGFTVFVATMWGRPYSALGGLGIGILCLAMFGAQGPGGVPLALAWVLAAIVLPLVAAGVAALFAKILGSQLLSRSRPRDRLAAVLPVEIFLLVFFSVLIAVGLTGVTHDGLILAVASCIAAILGLIVATVRWLGIKRKPFWITNDVDGVHNAHRTVIAIASVSAIALTATVTPLVVAGLTLSAAESAVADGATGLAAFLAGSVGHLVVLGGVVILAALGVILLGHISARHQAEALGPVGATHAVGAMGAGLISWSGAVLLGNPAAAAYAFYGGRVAAGLGQGHAGSLSQDTGQGGVGMAALRFFLETLGLMVLAAVVTLATYGLIRAIIG